MIDVGSGPPLVLIPGIQGRWEWMRTAVSELAKQWRVITSSLPGEPGVDAMDSASNDGFESLIRHVDNLMDVKHIPRAVICGVSFGGLIALRYAAQRPERVRALILVSTPGPRWRPEPHQERQMKRPVMSSPFFAAGAVRRSWAELRVTYPDFGERMRFCAKTIPAVLGAPAVPWRMGARARMAAAESFEGDCARITAPTLIVAGEQDLDRVVRPDDTKRYLTAINGSEFELFEHTGHLGSISAPRRFAAIVSRFLDA